MRVKQFKELAEEITTLYEVKDKAYGNSFGSTYEKLGIVSAVTRISDKYNRLCNLATNKDIDNLGESIEDTLKDMAAYCIMTIMELKKNKEEKSSSNNFPTMNVNQIAGFRVGDVVIECISDLVCREKKIAEIILWGVKILIRFEDGAFLSAKDEDEIKQRLTLKAL